MSSSFSSVPIIDVAPLLASLRSGEPLSADALATAGKLHEAAHHVGFFYVRGHGVSEQLQENLFAAAREFFKLSREQKEQFDMKMGGRAWRGWFALGGELTSGIPDLKEGYYFGTELGSDDARVEAKLPMHGANLFPDALIPELRESVLTYMSECRQLAQDLLSGLAVALLGESERSYFTSRFTNNPTELFRIFRYPEHTAALEADQWGVREHTDYGFLTILKQDNSGGLQVRSSKDEWVEAPPIEGTFVVNIGDMLEMWTRGVYRATPHRVRNQAKHDRFSFPFFFDPNFSATLEPIAENLLPANRREKMTRWDGANVEEARGTYGDYVLEKVLKVFPHLKDETKVE